MVPIITILCRKGSKGLPGKNKKILHGKPLYLWTVDTALEFKERHGCRVVVSSDDHEILTSCTNIGCTVVVRPESLAGDEVGKLDALRHAVGVAGGDCDTVIDLDVTNPLRTVEDIATSLEIFSDFRPKTLFSVTKARKNPYFNQIAANGGLVCEGKHKTRQSAPPVYDLNCNIYIYQRFWLENLNNHSPICDGCKIYEMPEWTAFDIDNQVDFEIVELMMSKYMGVN